MTGIREAVHERYATELAETDRAQFEQVVETKTIELEQLYDQEFAETRQRLTTQWQTEHQAPIGYQEQVELIQRAQQSARETVLALLWEGYPPQEETEPPTAMQRWETPEATEPTEATEELVAELWPTLAQESVRFRVLASYLLQARQEDDLAVPATPAEPLAAELEALLRQKVDEIAAVVDGR